jgi:hypothetical protein
MLHGRAPARQGPQLPTDGFCRFGQLSTENTELPGSTVVIVSGGALRCYKRAGFREEGIARDARKASDGGQIAARWLLPLDQDAFDRAWAAGDSDCK